MNIVDLDIDDVPVNIDGRNTTYAHKSDLNPRNKCSYDLTI